MAKSSLTFSERRKVLVLGSTADHVTRTLTKQDCGKWIVLTNLQGHAITLPTAVEAGEGWNCKFIVGAVQNDTSVRPNTTIVAQGTETVNAILKRVAASASAAAGSASARADVLNVAGVKADATNPGEESFTIQIPVAAGGSNTAFTFLFANDAEELPGTNAAGNFVINVDANAADTNIQNAVINAINGAADASVERPAAGLEGAEDGVGIKGITATVGTTGGEGGTRINLECDVVGAAASVGTDGNILTNGADNEVAIVGGTRSLAGGGDATGIIVSSQTTTITPTGSTIGDQLTFTVANGQWFVTSYRAA